MNSVKTYCKKKFPKNWEITEKGNGLFQFKDNSLVKGAGFLVDVQEELNKYEFKIIFEDFAKDLPIKAEKTISKVPNPLKKILDQNSHITAIINKQFVQTNFILLDFVHFDYYVFQK